MPAPAETASGASETSKRMRDSISGAVEGAKKLAKVSFAAKGEHAIPDKVGSFELITKGEVEYGGVSFAKWRSSESGLKVFWADVEGPIVSGYFSVATEIMDDSGRPHTLEHLIFMGSEKYPYKGVLDTLANRMCANGTNAWTSTTDTTYTIDTAGAEGFLGIMPVFIDHILYPTMTNAGFTTEVFHVNGKGECSGVVYSEMQGRENGSGDRMELQLQRSLFPKDSGYRSETGGLMEALRQLDVQQIRDYHRSSYLPHNLTLIVVGRSLSPQRLLETLQKEVEPSIIEHQQNQGPRPPGWVRPWVESTSATKPPAIHKDKREVVEFPEKDESVGEVAITWVGPKINDFLTCRATEILAVYLTDSAVSPLFKEFVEVEEPACTSIDFNNTTQDPVTITAYLSSVPAEKLDTLDGDFKKALARIAKEGIDMERMAQVLERHRLQLYEQMEGNQAGEVMGTSAIIDALFSPEDGSLLGPSFHDMKWQKQLCKWTAEQWSAFLLEWLVVNKSISVIGKPSAALADKLEKEEKARIAANVAKYGPEGLAKLAKTVEDAQKENDRDIPPEMISGFKLPDVEKIDWLSVESGRSAGPARGKKVAKNPVQDHVDTDNAELPVFVQFDHVNSVFVQISIHMFPSSETVSSDLRRLLPIYLDSFFTLPITRADGTKLPFEDVVKLLDAETLSYSIGNASPIGEGITLRMKVAKEKYGVAIAWLRDLLWGSEFSIDRLKIAVAKSIQNLPSEKRDGSGVSSYAWRDLLLEENSTMSSMNLLTRDASQPELLERLKTEPEAVQAEFEQLRTALLDPRTMRLSVKGDILDLPKPSSPWLENFKSLPPVKPEELAPVILETQVLNDLGREPSKKLVLFELPSIESCFAFHIAKGPSSYDHEDLPALTVARSVLNAMESFLWKYIRGAGLAYGANISQDIEGGFIYFRIYKSPDSHSAYAAAKKLIEGLVSGEIAVDELVLESAKSSLAYNTASRESTLNDAASAAFTNQVLLDLPANYNRRALELTKDISVEQVLAVIKKYISPIFDASTSVASIACGSGKVDDLVKRYEAEGFEVNKRTFGDLGDSDDESGSGSDGEGA